MDAKQLTKDELRYLWYKKRLQNKQPFTQVIDELCDLDEYLVIHNDHL